MLVFILVDNLATLPDTIIVDEEYTGKEDIIGESLRKLLVDKSRVKWQGQIRFKQIGKMSFAHKLAWKIHRAKKRPTDVKKILEDDILKLLI